MASNYEVEARGIAYWKDTNRSVSFMGTTYQIQFAELGPELFEDERVKIQDDHTVELTVEDPNGLV